jgi:predicted Zn-dependent protease
MMSRFDGGAFPREKTPRILLVFFGDCDPVIEEVLTRALTQFIGSILGELREVPDFFCRYEPVPKFIPRYTQHRVFFSALRKITGNIVIGVTDTEFYNPVLSRHVSCYGQVDGRGMLSTYPFRKETHNPRLFRERLNKQVLRVFAMACTVESCLDSECIISDHRRVEDLDRTRYVCQPCREDFVRNLTFFLSVPGSCPGTLLLPECE